MKRAQGVLGPIDAADVGVALTHEHLLWDLAPWQSTPRADREHEAARGPVRPEVRATLRFDPCLSLDNLVHRDVDVASEELGDALAAGVRTVVDPTNVSLGRNPEALARIARRTGAQIVMGSGWYYQLVLDDAFAARSPADLTAELVRDVTVGAGATGIRAGVIGEIGTSAPITPLEERSVRAAARAQHETGAPLMVHLDGWGREGHRVLDLVAAEGGDVTRTLLCHLNPSWDDDAYQRSLAERGAYLGFDMFGVDHFYPPDRASPDELSALRAIARLVAQGHRDRLLLSHDVYLKTMLRRHGGYGYGHLLTTLRPYFGLVGLTDDDVEALFTANPRAFLCFL